MTVKGSNLRQIAVSKANYLRLKNLGQTADSFNDVVTKLLDHAEGGRKR